MSAAKMVADSTQSELAEMQDSKKRKKKIKKAGKKVVLPEDEDSDLDLKKELKPIGAFVKDRSGMIEEMFRAVRGASLQRALPDLLKSIPVEELKLLCLEQLEVMSKKRIRRILAGEESANISSSGTEDETSDEEAGQSDGPSQQPASGKTPVEGHQADSTSVHQETTRNQGISEEPVALVEVKLEALDSAEEVDPEIEEEAEEEPPEAYTSGSEDGELVKREEQDDYFQDARVKQEPMSGEEYMEEEEEEEMNVEELEGQLLASLQGGSTDEGVLPSIMMDQMELLELEMRARAIKAMLSSHDHTQLHGEHSQEEDEEEEYFEPEEEEVEADGEDSNHLDDS